MRTKRMDPALKSFLHGMTPLVEERLDWSGNGKAFVQTRFTYALEEAASPPVGMVTSVRALLTSGPNVIVVRDPGGEHIAPGGRVEDGEGLLDALKRELLEETGWTVRGEPALVGLFHYHIHSPKPAEYPYPYPDFLQLLYIAEADRHIPEAMEVDGFELGAEFQPRHQAERLSLTAGEVVLLRLVDNV